MNRDKIEEIVEQLFSASEVAAWFQNDMTKRLEEEGYELTQAGRLQLRAALEEMAEDYISDAAHEVNRNLEMAGFPSSDEEADEILEFLQSDAGEIFLGFFQNYPFKHGVLAMLRRLKGNDYLHDPIETEELLNRMEEVEPHEIFEANPPDGASPDDPFFEETP